MLSAASTAAIAIAADARTLLGTPLPLQQCDVDAANGQHDQASDRDPNQHPHEVAGVGGGTARTSKSREGSR